MSDSTSSAPAFSVVVCTRHRPELLERCLASLREQDHDDYELVVVDNSGGDERARLASERAGARYVVEPTVGVSPARNTGASAAIGEIVAFIDDDAIAASGWLSAFSSAFEHDSLAGATGRTLAWPPDSPVARAQSASGSSDAGERAFRLDRNNPDWFELSNFGAMGAGMNMAFRRELFDRYSGFSESLGLGTGLWGEEHYWLFTLIKNGNVVAYVPEAIVHHQAPETMAGLRDLQRETLRQGAAYCLVLLSKEPGYRRRVIRYALSGLGGNRREWRPPVPNAASDSRRHRVSAALAATALYGRWWMRYRRNSTGS